MFGTFIFAHTDYVKNYDEDDEITLASIFD